MRVTFVTLKRSIAALMILAMLVVAVSGALAVSAQEADRPAAQGAENYYLWGVNSNDPDFGAMTSPTGAFSYDGTKGYYYYDLQGASGDYCFVISKVSNSGATAVRTPAVGGVANAGKYYLSQGNYRGYACMHLWNQAGDAIRIYFVSESAGANAIPLSEAGSTPTVKPTSAQPTSPQPTSAQPTSSTGTKYVYCENAAGWGSVYVYMWNDSGSNGEWPGKQATKVSGNIWRYAVSGSYNNIIFNGGSDQQKTSDLSYPGDGYIYNNATGQWSVYGGTSPTTPQPTSPQPTSAQPTSPQPTTPSGGQYIYCENELGWSTVTVYLWNGSGNVNNGGWPGQTATKIGGNIWRYTLPRTYENIIFSNNGQDQSADMTFPGAGYMYNNKTKKWDVYDTSPLQVQSYTTDLQSPQLTGVGVVLSASAAGQGTVTYKFTVQNSSGSATFTRNYSVVDHALWTPNAPGKYTITYEFIDTSGNYNKRTLSYTVQDALSSVEPYIKQVTPISGEQIKNGASCAVNVTAGGGLTGTKLLFYKYTVRDAAGDIVNVPYYTRSTSYSFKPASLGKYTLTVSVQGSDNTTVERDYVYTSVGTITTPTEPAVIPTVKPTTSSSDPSVPSGSNKIGDADGDGTVTILDATRIQRWLADLVGDSAINKSNADADRDGTVTIIDATHIQRFLAGLINSL